jgi:hypothetical protein
MDTPASVWNSIRDFGAGHITEIVAVVIVAIGATLLIWRPSPGELTASRLQQFLLVAAVILAVSALMAAVYDMIDFDEDHPSFVQQLMDGIKELPVATLLLLIGLLVLCGAYLVKRSGASWTTDAVTGLSMSTLRDVAVVAGVFLLATAAIVSVAWYLVAGTFSSEYSMIAPFTIAGSDDKQRGLALAAALQAKLGDIERDADSINEVFQSERTERETDSGLSQELVEKSALNVYRKIDLELKFQGVDVGGIFTRVIDWFASRRALQITVAEQGTSAIVSGSLTPDGSSHVYAEIGSATNERIVAAVAYSKLRERLIANQAGYGSLKWEDVEALHNTIVAAADLRERSEVKMEQYKPYLKTMTDLIAKAPRLEGLLMLGAEVAMKAGQVDQALAFLDRDRATLSDLHDRLDSRRPAPGAPATSNDDDDDSFQDLQSEFIQRFNALLVQRQRALSSCALAFVERLHGGAEAPATVFDEAMAQHRKLLRIEPVADPAYTPKVAIVGGVPQRDSVSYGFESVGTTPVARAGYDNFADTLGMIVSTLAPRAKLLFIPLGVHSQARGSTLRPREDEIGQAVGKAAAANADIVLVPFIYRDDGRADWLNALQDKVLVVTPAPSRAFQETDKIDAAKLHAAFIGNADVDGRFKLATLDPQEVPLSYPGALWSVGTRIPRLAADGMWEAAYGSGFASATAAAVFANILSKFGKTAPADLVDRVRKTVRQLDIRDPAIGVIDQKAALEGAKSTRSDPPETGKACGTHDSSAGTPG